MCLETTHAFGDHFGWQLGRSTLHSSGPWSCSSMAIFSISRTSSRRPPRQNKLSNKNKSPFSLSLLSFKRLHSFFYWQQPAILNSIWCGWIVDVVMGSEVQPRDQVLVKVRLLLFRLSFLRHHSSFLFLSSLNLTTFLECKDGKNSSDFDHDVRKCDGQMHFAWSVWGINMLEHHRSSAPLWWKSSLKMIHGISYDLLGLLLLGKFPLNGTNEESSSFWRRALPTHFERMERHSLRLKRNVIRHTRSGLDQTYQKTTKYILPFCHCLSSAGWYLSIYIWSKKIFLVTC